MLSLLPFANRMPMVKTWFIEADYEWHWKEIVDRTMLKGLNEVDPNVHPGFKYTWQYPRLQDGIIGNVYVDYTVSFGEMTQKNESRETVRKLLCSLSNGAECIPADAEGCKFLVKVEGKGMWCELDDQLVHCALFKEDKSHVFQCCGYEYILDLKAMKQINNDTGKERDVIVARR